MSQDKRFIELLACSFEDLPHRIRNIHLKCTEIEICNELVLVAIGKILNSIQCSDMKHKKEIKFAFLENIESMVDTMKKHRKDLHMEDNG